jgi:hypothetical protein
LVAATTLGASHAASRRAEIKVEDGQALEAKRSYRLIVQSYPSRLGGAVAIPTPSHRPRGSAQRAVTADELERGVHVNLFEIANELGAHDDEPGVLMAWIEPGEPDLEFDARRARPAPGSVYGLASCAHDDDGRVAILLDRRVQAA